MMPADRTAHQLTGYVPPKMARPGPVPPEKDGIFGPTYGGVPNPMIPYEHPYPTRYHGPVFVYPQPGYQYETAPYARAPFDGLGEFPWKFDRSFTGSSIVDALVGAAVGYVASPTKDEAVVHAAAGALSGGFLGSTGLIALLLGEILLQHKKQSRRADLPGL